ncbi:hypothetical protein BX616_002091 [Lobosporangium transversale]|uniref:Uncharacterized protein n=1 Tax=Lobosporangium transversale TaxID=64571 RepID=A0A1Y2GUP3_9FUNG|nr:hypothetical protein BCR41DRAFT_368643 [Lobosporangium transversale]KAF9917036.1 hypothetical protein BX616_002091 [Lobosporangium transversale]ORZ24810.1 hypothetical protein BCR41DRAFT_368643 [Lobosporangium transversale]|eukprot:XP_021883791.1 hypothetical protein BCR41DRAFT_368643 [Lobosporangium transversale]
MGNTAERTIWGSSSINRRNPTPITICKNYQSKVLHENDKFNNPRSGSFLFVNEVEVYGRKRLQNPHHEQTRIVKHVPKKTFMPKTVGEDHFFRVRPITMERSDGKHFVIGTFECDILIKSEESISSGITHKILTFLKHIRIFLDKERLRQAFWTTNRFSVNYLFTFANHIIVRDAGFAAGILFDRVGKSVTTLGERAVLQLMYFSTKAPESKPAFFHYLEDLSQRLIDIYLLLAKLGCKSVGKGEKEKRKERENSECI